MPQGALIQAFVVGGRNIVLGYVNPEPYRHAPYFGETIGRVANRIRSGILNNLNGQDYQLAQNNEGNALHGGNEGWGKKIFTGPVYPDSHGKNGVEIATFQYTSPDGDEGYPGEIDLLVTYSVYQEVEDGKEKIVLEAQYEATLGTGPVAESVLNITNHR